MLDQKKRLPSMCLILYFIKYKLFDIIPGMRISSDPPGQENSLVQVRQLEAEKLSLSEYVPGLQISQLK